MAVYIAATQAAHTTGADFVVDTPVGVSCYGATGKDELVATVFKKNSDLSYTRLTSRVNPNASSVTVTLGVVQTDFVIIKPGTYKIEKKVTDGTVGIDIEQ